MEIQMDKSKFKFEKEIEVLDQMFNDMVEAIHLKPDGNDIEELRLYVDNTYSVLNSTALRVKELKNQLLKDSKLILETWNPPA
jgi:peptidase E